ncbi:flavodoxin domain-containing protein [Enterococcus sp. LJL128]
MKTMIIYDSKHGSTSHIAKMIGCELQFDVQLSDIQEPISLSDDFNQIIFLAPAYAGQLRKQAAAFLASHQEALLQKTLILVNTGLQFSEEKIAQQLQAIFPAALREHAELTAFAGSIIYPDKLNFFEKLILKKIFHDQRLEFPRHETDHYLDKSALDSIVQALNEQEGRTYST